MKLALGVFDGVHLGHQKIIETAHRVITFDPHPNKGVHLLTTLQERQDLIGNLDVLKFTSRIANMYPQDFIEQIIVRKYRPEIIIVGHDYAFGYNRSGKVDTLIELGKKYNFKVEVIDEVIIDGHPVRSSLIRKLLAKGDVKEANKLLGRDYVLTGKVVHGHGRGIGLGFPTVNLKTDVSKLVPGQGVYKGEAIYQNKIYKAAIFIGERQTFGEHERVIEAHLLNFHEQAYGKQVTLFFQDFLRPEQKFTGADQLIEQIKKDISRI